MTDKYFVPRSTVVKAFEMTQELIESKGPFPDWVSPHLRFGVSQHGEAVAIKQPNGSTERIPPGFFVAYEGTTKIKVYNPEAFSKVYIEKEVVDAEIIENIKALVTPPSAPVGV